MALQLILADSSAGKTEYVQRNLLELKQHDPLAKIWILMATERQINAFRSRLIETSPQRALFNLEFFDFYSLYRHLLAAAGQPQRTLDDIARRLLMRSVVMQRPDGLFAPIASAPGLSRVLSEFIFELKENLVTPEQFSAATYDAKTAELAAIYANYQAVLREHSLVDREGEGWLALQAVQTKPEVVRDVQMLIVDGYDQFPRVQAQLLAALGQHIHTLITLTDPEGRPLLGKRFAQARERLYEAASDFLTTVTLPLIPDQRPSVLSHLSRNLMSTAAPKLEAVHSPALRLIEAPDAAGEVDIILRNLKALLLAGSQPDDVLIALRDWSMYAPLLRMGCRRLNIPAIFHRAQPLIQNPAITAVFALLDLPASDFRRRDLLDVLRSPYFDIPGIGSDGAAILERLSLTHIITGGRDRWLTALDAQINRTEAVISEDEDDQPDFSLDTLRALRDSLALFFQQITPPPEGDFEIYALWLENLLGPDPYMLIQEPPEEDTAIFVYHLNLPAQIRRAQERRLIERDIAALDRLKSAIRSLHTADLLAASFGVQPPRDFASFLASVRAAAETDFVEGRQRDGHILVTTINDARGVPHRHLIMPGFSEGIFPAPAPEDPLLLDEERLRLRENGIPLSTQAERTDDFGIFYELINQARSTIILTRPTVKNGAPWVESPLWRSVVSLFEDLEIVRFKPGDLYPPELAPTLADTAIALATNDDPRYTPYTAWLAQTHPALVNRLRRNWQSEQDRLKRRRSVFNGHLQDAALVQMVSEVLDESYLWSASQLDLIGTCGFRFFAGRILRLEPITEPQVGPDAPMRGSISHKILEQVYQILSENGIQPNADGLETALAALDHVSTQVLETAPTTFGFAPPPLWEQESAAIRGRLQKVLRADFERTLKLNKQFPWSRQLRAQELRFGEDTPLRITLDEDTVIHLRGTIDRIDLADDGQRVLIIDYKSGSEGSLPTLKQYMQGRSFQMMTYLLAARELVGTHEIGGAFVSLRDAKSSDVLWLDVQPDDTNGKVLDSETGKAALARYVQLARRGDFSAESNGIEEGKCHSFCDYAKLCRIHVMERRQPNLRATPNETLH